MRGSPHGGSAPRPLRGGGGGGARNPRVAFCAVVALSIGAFVMGLQHASLATGRSSGYAIAPRGASGAIRAPPPVQMPVQQPQQQQVQNALPQHGPSAASSAHVGRVDIPPVDDSAAALQPQSQPTYERVGQLPPFEDLDVAESAVTWTAAPACAQADAPAAARPVLVVVVPPVIIQAPGSVGATLHALPLTTGRAAARGVVRHYTAATVGDDGSGFFCTPAVALLALPWAECASTETRCREATLVRGVLEVRVPFDGDTMSAGSWYAAALATLAKATARDDAFSTLQSGGLLFVDVAATPAASKVRNWAGTVLDGLSLPAVDGAIALPTCYEVADRDTLGASCFAIAAANLRRVAAHLDGSQHQQQGGGVVSQLAGRSGALDDGPHSAATLADDVKRFVRAAIAAESSLHQNRAALADLYGAVGRVAGMMQCKDPARLQQPATNVLDPKRVCEALAHARGLAGLPGKAAGFAWRARRALAGGAWSTALPPRAMDDWAALPPAGLCVVKSTASDDGGEGDWRTCPTDTGGSDDGGGGGGSRVTEDAIRDLIGGIPSPVFRRAPTLVQATQRLVEAAKPVADAVQLVNNYVALAGLPRACTHCACDPAGVDGRLYQAKHREAVRWCQTRLQRLVATTSAEARAAVESLRPVLRDVLESTRALARRTVTAHAERSWAELAAAVRSAPKVVVAVLTEDTKMEPRVLSSALERSAADGLRKVLGRPAFLEALSSGDGAEREAGGSRALHWLAEVLHPGVVEAIDPPSDLLEFASAPPAVPDSPQSPEQPATASAASSEAPDAEA